MKVIVFQIALPQVDVVYLRRIYAGSQSLCVRLEQMRRSYIMILRKLLIFSNQISGNEFFAAENIVAVQYMVEWFS